MGIPFGFGVRALYDSHMNYWRPGLPCALRVTNYVVPDTGYGELGFSFAPTGNIIDQAGFTDVPIRPQPEVMEMGNHDVGIGQKQLMFGPTKFIISHTFVLKRMQELNLSDPYQVWRDKSVMGLAYPVEFAKTADVFAVIPNAMTRLFNIQSITKDEIAGQILAWTLMTLAPETLVNVKGS